MYRHRLNAVTGVRALEDLPCIMHDEAVRRYGPQRISCLCTHGTSLFILTIIPRTACPIHHSVRWSPQRTPNLRCSANTWDIAHTFCDWLFTRSGACSPQRQTSASQQSAARTHTHTLRLPGCYCEQCAACQAHCTTAKLVCPRVAPQLTITATQTAHTAAQDRRPQRSQPSRMPHSVCSCAQPCAPHHASSQRISDYTSMVLSCNHVHSLQSVQTTHRAVAYRLDEAA